MGSVSGKSANDSSSFSSYRRRAHHAGSWYSNDTNTLGSTLDASLKAAAQEMVSNISGAATVRAILCPHAGYSYSGPTAAYSYLALQQELQQRQSSLPSHGPNGNNDIDDHLIIVVLHPSHHVYLETCAVSGATVIETPLGDLPVNHALRQEILQLPENFTVMSKFDDEHEHSGEMQYPYLRHIINTAFSSRATSMERVSILPIMCGALSQSAEARYGRVLAPILARPNVVTVISSDFCHWGQRFRYQPTAPSASSSMPIHKFIQQLDQQGMDLIAADWQRPGAFADYLRQTRNTICGRHAIAVWLNALATTYPKQDRDSATASFDDTPAIQFVKYAQSSAVESLFDSSVSYAAAVCTLPSAERSSPMLPN